MKVSSRVWVGAVVLWLGGMMSMPTPVDAQTASGQTSPDQSATEQHSSESVGSSSDDHVARPGEGEVATGEGVGAADPMALAPRLRAGWAYGMGPVFGFSEGIGTTFAGRIGVQLNEYFSVYYQISPVLGLLFGEEAQALAAVNNDAVFEATLLDFIQMAFGVGPDVGYFSNCAGGAMSSLCEGFAGAAFGLDGRIAFALGGWQGFQGETRKALSIGMRVHATFIDDRFMVSTLMITIGEEWF